jgi:ATP-dependent DNA helicase RecG
MNRKKTAVDTPQIQKVPEYIQTNGQITDKEIGNLLNLKKTRIFNITKQMRDIGLIQVIGRDEQKNI